MLVCLEGLSEAQSVAPSVTNAIIDGAAVVQMLKPGATKTFQEYTNQAGVYSVHLWTASICITSRFGVGQLQNGLSEGNSQGKRGKGVRRRVIESALIPGNWQNFLRVDLNKTELFTFLSKSLLQSFIELESTKEIVVTDGEQVFSDPSQNDVYLLSPCSHEEADSRMMLYM